MTTLAGALIKHGDPDMHAEDFSQYKNEEDFINEILSEAPGFHNIGAPRPYPNLPEGCLIVGTPDNPSAEWGAKVIKKGLPLTVEWLRNNNGVAVWPASYYRYKKPDGSPSGFYPKTASKKFEFKFNYLSSINSKFGTDFPTSFYWSECKWNPGNSDYKDIAKDYPFQLVSGRVHHAMTMTAVCSSLAETETECMKLLNNAFSYTAPETGSLPDKSGLPANKEVYFKAGAVSIPVLAFHTSAGQHLGIQTGDTVVLENPLKKTIRGIAYLTEEVMPGIIKTAFGPGGQRASGLGFANAFSEYTPNINELHDPENISPFTGMPGFGDIMVKVIKDAE